MPASIAEDLKSRFFEHGGRLDAARIAFPEAPKPWIDLSTGISPWPYPMPALPEEDWRRLPDLAALESLTQGARKAYRAPKTAEIVPLPGEDLGLSLIPWLFRAPRRVAILGPTYGGHAAAWLAAGHTVWEMGNLEDVGRASIVIVVNPNNPDGRFEPHARLAGILGRLYHKDGLLIIDEAFADAEPAHSILPFVNRLDRTVVLRSFGKFFGAAGIRLGFAITSHPLARRLREALGSWPISAAALAAGTAALSDEAWISNQRARLKDAAAKLDMLLAGAGLNVAGGTSLFRYASHDPELDLFERLARRGILVRPFRDKPALRIGLPRNEEESRRLRDVLRDSVAS